MEGGGVAVKKAPADPVPDLLDGFQEAPVVKAFLNNR